MDPFLKKMSNLNFMDFKNYENDVLGLENHPTSSNSIFNGSDYVNSSSSNNQFYNSQFNKPSSSSRSKKYNLLDSSSNSQSKDENENAFGNHLTNEFFEPKINDESADEEFRKNFKLLCNKDGCNNEKLINFLHSSDDLNSVTKDLLKELSAKK